MQSRRVYLRRNTLMSLAFELATIICGFILPKYILSAYGSATNGLVSSVSQFLGFISLCELGMGAVVPASLYRPLANRDMDAVSRVVVSAQKFYRIVAGILLGYIALLVVFYPLLIKEAFSFSFTAGIIIIISVSTFAQYYFGITYSLLLKSDQKQYIALTLNIVTLVLNTVVSIVLIKAGFGIHTVKLASSIIYISRPLFLTYYVKKHYHLNLRIRYEGEPIKQKWNGMAQHFATTIQEKADTIILTAMSTLTNVSIYGVYFMVINGIKGLVYSLTPGVSAMLGNMLARDEMESLKQSFHSFEWAMHTVSTLLFTITAILVVPFVQVYTANLEDTQLYYAPAFAAIMSVALALRCIQMPYNTMIHVAGHFKETQLSAILEPIINIIVSIAAVYRYGLVGVAIGTMVSMGYRVIYLACYLMKNIIHISGRSFIMQISVDVIGVLLMILATRWLKLNSITYINWIALAIPVALICTAVVVALNACVYRTELLTALKKLHRG